MIETILEYSTNLLQGPPITQLTQPLASFDQEAHTFRVNVYRGRESVNLDGAVVTGYFVPQDKTTILIGGRVKDAAAELTLPAECYQQTGAFALVIKAAMGSVVHTIYMGKGTVITSRTDKATDPGSIIPSLDAVLAQIAAMDMATVLAEQAADAATTATAAADAATARATAAAESAEEAAETANASAQKADAAAQAATESAGESVDNATAAAEKADTAAQAANAAAGKADTAADKADAATAAATSAAAEARSARDAANTAATAADTARGKTETATAKADTASASATASAGKAEQAATAANNATDAANTATTAANKAASAANTATDAANKATSAATAAAGEANKAADNAKSAVEYVDVIDCYDGIDLTVKFADEIANYSDPWAWIQARIQANKFAGLHVCDYIPFTTTNGYTFNARIGGINTYYRTGAAPQKRHIDFITQETWPETFQMNLVDYNNGTSDQPVPWLASNGYLYVNSLAGQVPNSTTLPLEMTDVDYTTSGIYYYLPDELKAVITEKLAYINTRYSKSGLLTDDNSQQFANLGKLWIPSEFEIAGSSILGSAATKDGTGYVQYPLFANNMKRLFVAKTVGRAGIWLTDAVKAVSSKFSRDDAIGRISTVFATGNNYAPICFRIQAT